ncbi:MAG: glycosyl hydrolase [Planctomycetales bacterium]|nr:glycosyl hydrolase [Planctomycetales bacterium]
MFFESAWSRKSIGDVDVVFHDGLYHLFHLVLPNHDFVAHAISDNALNWRRVDNALFIGHPGSWDDLMLWTMHVSQDPYREGKWRMFYTGLSRRDQGLMQRVGMATSDDLFTWRKSPVNWKDRRGSTDPELVKEARKRLPRGISDSIQSIQDSTSCFPLEPDPKYYEASIEEARGWVSFRDPFYFRDADNGWLLAAARTNDGPLVRRGCVAAMKETEPNIFTAQPPLHAPQIYDDIEVPNLFRESGEFYLIGSLREDAKIRYWHCDDLSGPWRNYHDNVLLPKGNYAGRICQDDNGTLLWNFFTDTVADRTSNNIMPPPKRLRCNRDGLLRATTFEGILQRVKGKLDCLRVRPLKPQAGPERSLIQSAQLRMISEAGFQAYVHEEEIDDFVLSATMMMQGFGKCGLIFRVDPQTHDGYYVSLDLMKGIAQVRAWGTGPLGSGEEMMQFRSLQSGNWYDEDPRNVEIRLLAFGSYLELSVNERVVLSLADDTFAHGLVGFYVETADLLAKNLSLELLESPTQSDDHLANG